MKNRILVVEDDTAISELICMNLTVAGYEVKAVFDGDEAEKAVRTQGDFDLALLDIMLPGKDGFELMELMQKKKIPVIYLTAKGDVGSKIRGLRSGAEDYIVKPFEVLERTGRQISRINVADVEINLTEHVVLKNGEEISLKPLEYDLLVLLAKNKNVAFSREQLLSDVWGSDYLGETRTVDVHIGQLRKKLGFSEVIKTIPKIGYRLED